MIRVLHVVGGMGQGGVENFIMNVYEHIDRTKIQFDFLVNRYGQFDNRIRELGGNIYKIEALQKQGQINYTKELRNFFRTHKYKIVHSHLNKVSGLILECAKKEGIQVKIAHSHNNKSASNPFINAYKQYLGKKIVSNSDILLACSEDAAKYMFGSTENVIIINNAIDLNRFRYSKKNRLEIRNKYRIKEDTIVIGCVARFSKQKNHRFLLEVFKEYIKNNRNAILFLIGEGKLKQKIINRIESLKIADNVIIADTTFEIEKYYSAFDCFVLPSLFEGLGIVLIESQVSGLETLTSSGVVAREAKISDKIHYIKLDNNPKEWASYIKKSKNRLIDDIGKEYNINNIAKQIEGIYVQSIKG